MSAGWVREYRAFKDHPVFRQPVRAHLFNWCILSATHARHKTLLGSREVVLQPGQFCTGRHRAAQETGLSPKQVRAGFVALEKLDMIRVETGQGWQGSIVTVVNWGKYQSNGHEPCPDAPGPGTRPGYGANQKGVTARRREVGANQGPTRGQPGATIQEGEEGKEVLSPPRAREGPPGIPCEIESMAMQVYGSVPTASLSEWCEVHGPDWVRRAIAITERRQRRSPQYTLRILQDWAQKGEPDDEQSTDARSGVHRKGPTPRGEPSHLAAGSAELEGL